jgi:hypothetical protein
MMFSGRKTAAMIARNLTDRRVADAGAIAAIVIVITIVFADVLFGGACFFVRDLTRYYFPTKHLIHDIVLRGEFPLWNPAYSAGQPMAANPEYEVFYPGQWPIFLRDFFLGYRLHIVLHFYIAALAMYALMRSLGARVTASLATAFTYVFGGIILSSTNLLPILFPLAWLPLTLLFTQRGNYGAVAIFLGIEVLAFEPSVLIETFVLIALIALWRRDWKALLVIPGGLAIGAVQLVPMLDFVRHTTRAAGLTFDAVSAWSMPPSRLVELLQPHWFGREPLTSMNYWGGAAYRNGTPFLLSIYIGLAAIVAVIAGILHRDRRVIGLACVAAGAWIVALGEHTPLLRMMFASGLPFPMRFPERFAVLSGVALTIAAGLALERIIAEAVVRTTVLRVASAIAVAYAFGAMVSAHRIEWVWMIVRVALLILVLLFGRRRLGFALVVFTLVDLLPLEPELMPRKPREFFTPPPVARELARSSDGYRIFFEPEWNNGPIARNYFSDRRSVYDVIRAGMFPRLPAAFGFHTVFEADIDRTNLVHTEELTRAMWAVRAAGRRDWAEIFATVANVEYRAAFRPPPSAEPIIFVPIGHHPRYWFADEIVRGDDFVSAHSVHAAHVDIAPFAPVPGVIRNIDERSNRVALDVTASGRSFLVASNTFDDHWRATIDGRRVPLLRTNIAMQGMVVPAGGHHIELAYVNPWIFIGAAISVLALLTACRLRTWPTSRSRSISRMPDDSPVAC